MQAGIRRLVILSVSQLSSQQSLPGPSGPSALGKANQGGWTRGSTPHGEREGGRSPELFWRAFRMGHGFRWRIHCLQRQYGAESGSGSAADLHPAS